MDRPVGVNIGKRQAGNGGAAEDGRSTVSALGMNKLWPDAHAALDDIVRDGMLLAIGGFGLCGIPEALILGVARYGRAQSDHRQQ